MKELAQEQATRILMEGMEYRHGTDVWRTWFERGPAQWKRWVIQQGRVPGGKLCSVPSADVPPKSA